MRVRVTLTLTSRELLPMFHSLVSCELPSCIRFERPPAPPAFRFRPLSSTAAMSKATQPPRFQSAWLGFGLGLGLGLGFGFGFGFGSGSGLGLGLGLG